jgi:uncharacterized protein YbjQ (UPF0145 family)
MAVLRALEVTLADWNGEGLPPAAQRRLAHTTSLRTSSSLLGVASAAGIESVGYRPISEVVGVVVLSLSGAAMPNCGYYGMGFGMAMAPGSATTYLADSLQQTAAQGYEPYVDVLNRGWHIAIGRMMTEAGALHADGVVGVVLSQRRFEGGAMEFMALGTAVGATDPKRRGERAQPFSTHLGGVDLEKLSQGGFAPSRIVVEVSLAIRHDDYATMLAGSFWSQNMEMTGYSELISTARHGVRRRLERYLHREHAHGAIISSFDTSVFEYAPIEGHRDHLAEARVVGTMIRETGRPTKQEDPLMMLSLK